MRTQQEMLDRIAKHDNFLGTVMEDLFAHLEFEHARELMNDEAKAKYDSGEDTWEPAPVVREKIVEEMRDYMDFALGKAHDERGISASRSVTHYQTWLWLIGDAKTLAFAEDGNNYDAYGLPILEHICEAYGIETSR